MTNKDIIQSHVLTIARYDANVYAKRILTHIVNANQNYIQGVKFNGGVIINIEEDLFREREYTFLIKNILQGEEDQNYNRVIKAFYSLQERFLRFDDEENNHISVPFLTSVIVKRGAGLVKFKMSELVYKAFTDFTRGYRKFEFELTLSFTSVYSMRFYEIMSGQKIPYKKTIEDLKKMFGLEKKYKNVNDFIRYVIVPAKQELDEKSPYTFDYEINKKGRAFHSVTFFPIYQPQYRNENLETKDLQKKTAISWVLDRNTKNYLMNAFSFSSAELKQNIALLENANKAIDLISFLAKIKPRANRATNPKGYVINAIKKELKIE